jgi:alpha-tubulin suppressor-like RCC1 family protein
MKNIYKETVNSLRYYKNGVEVLNTEDPWKQNGDDIYFDGGNMAIGKTDAQTKLDVNGEIFAEGSVKSQYLSSLYSLKLSERTYVNQTSLISAGNSSVSMVLNTGKTLSFGFNNDGQLGTGDIVNKKVPTDVKITDDYDGTNVKSISIGGVDDNFASHGAILLETGKVLTFGHNEDGQLGIGVSDSQRNSPEAVVNGADYDGTNAAMVSCGGKHTAILLKSGKVITFGNNIEGQLGNGTVSQSPTSIPISVNESSGYDGTNAVMVSCGWVHTAILLNTGKVLIFGDAGTQGDITQPTSVTEGNLYNGENAIMVSCGNKFTVILLNTGKVVSFGFNSFGQLGNGNTSLQSSPVPVVYENGDHLEDAIMVSAGTNHTMVLLKDGNVVSFGRNQFGELGIGGEVGSNVIENTPAEVVVSNGYNKERVVTISSGGHHSAILLDNGKVLTFGNNQVGELGNNTNIDSNIPVAVYESSSDYNGKNAFYKYLDLAIGNLNTGISNDRMNGLSIYSNRTHIENYDFYHLKEHGAINIDGQINIVNDHLRKHYLDSLHSMKLDERTLINQSSIICAGPENGGVILNNGKALTFGDNLYGQLGIGSTDLSRNVPTEVAIGNGYNGYNAVSINCSGIEGSGNQKHSAILLNTGKVLTFGSNIYGQLGIGNTTSPQRSPVEMVDSNGVYDGSNAIMICCGANHTAVLLNTGRVLTFGRNNYGQLGTGNTGASQTSPVEVVTSGNDYDGTNAVMISCGLYHTTILLNTGKVLTFGRNIFGQLGNGLSGDANNSNIPVDVSGVNGYDGTNAVMISSEGWHTGILLNTGKVLVFGFNGVGQLGIGTSGSGTNQVVPVQMNISNGYDDNAIFINCSRNNTSVILNDGKILNCGRNLEGQIGDNSQTRRVVLTPLIKINGYNETNAAASNYGENFALFLLNTGKVLSVGSNRDGQLAINEPPGSGLISIEPLEIVDPSNNYNGENAFYENLMDLTFDDKKVGITKDKDDELTVIAERVYVNGDLIMTVGDVLERISQLENRIQALE